jgi:hypothetical protein
MWRLSGDTALARGELPAVAESVASIRSVLDDARYQDQYHLPMVRLEAELRLAQGRPAEALSAVQDALDRFDVRLSPRYTWPLLVVGALACVAAAVGRDEALLAKSAAMRDRLYAETGKLATDGQAQQAQRLTFAAEAGRVGHALSGGMRRPGDMRTAWDEAPPAPPRRPRCTPPSATSWPSPGSLTCTAKPGARPWPAPPPICRRPRLQRAGSGFRSAFASGPPTEARPRAPQRNRRSQRKQTRRMRANTT